MDVVGVLTESADGRKYWNKLKQWLKEEGSQLVTNCHQLKMKAADGKRRLTGVADTEQLLRIIQSIPSKKAGHSSKNATQLNHVVTQMIEASAKVVEEDDHKRQDI